MRFNFLMTLINATPQQASVMTRQITAIVRAISMPSRFPANRGNGANKERLKMLRTMAKREFLFIDFTIERLLDIK